MEAYKFARQVLPHVALAECLPELRPLAAADFGEHSRLLWLGVLYLGTLTLAATSTDGIACELALTVFRGAATVEGNHEAPIVHNLKGYERAVAQVMIGDEPRPPATDACRSYSTRHAGKPPKAHWPLLRAPYGGHEGAILFPRPPCLREECRWDILLFSSPHGRRQYAPHTHLKVTLLTHSWSGSKNR